MPADQVIYGLEHQTTRDGIRSSILRGDTAYLHEGGQRLDLRGVQMEFFGENGQRTGTLTSRTGEYQVATGNYVARGEVVLITEEAPPRRIETEELHYDTRGDRLWSEVPFVLHEGDRVTRGTSFQSDSRFRNWTVTNAETEGGLPRTGEEVSF